MHARMRREGWWPTSLRSLLSLCKMSLILFCNHEHRSKVRAIESKVHGYDKESLYRGVIGSAESSSQAASIGTLFRRPSATSCAAHATAVHAAPHKSFAKGISDLRAKCRASGWVDCARKPHTLMPAIVLYRTLVALLQERLAENLLRI